MGSGVMRIIVVVMMATPVSMVMMVAVVTMLTGVSVLMLPS